MLALQIGRWVLLGLEIILGLPILYLTILSISALWRASRRRRQSKMLVSQTSLARFAILIPAHDEVPVLDKLLKSLAELDYPRDQFTAYVIADNCTDGTADLARSNGLVEVYERFDKEKRGKGFALSWMWQQLEIEQKVYDAYVVLDADSVVDAAFLQALNGGFQQGALALQAQNNVLNVSDSPSTALRWLALTLMNHVRPLGRNGLGGSSTLTGNGMCLTHKLLQEHPWQAFSQTEDYQYYLNLIQQGGRVSYIPEAVVLSEMPLTFSQMRTQDIRWEASEGSMVNWRRAWKLFKSGLKHRDFVRFEAIAELLTPTLSSLLCCCFLLLLASLALWSFPALLVALLLCAGFAFYISTAFLLLRPPHTMLLALLSAPRFVFWKVWVLLVVRRSKKSQGGWVRTSRNTLS